MRESLKLSALFDDKIGGVEMGYGKSMSRNKLNLKNDFSSGLLLRLTAMELVTKLPSLE